MHPIERLRSLARADWLDPQTIAMEAADAMGDAARWLGDATAVSIARRLLAWHSFCGPLWYAATRILQAVDPADEASVVVEELLADPTALMLDAALPDGARPFVVGDGPGLADIARSTRFASADPDLFEVPFGDRGGRFAAFGSHLPMSRHQTRAFVEGASHVLVGALVLGPDGVFSRSPATDAVEAARAAGKPVWGIAGLGTAIDAGLWARLCDLADSGRTRPETTVRSDVWWDDPDPRTGPPVERVDLSDLSFVCGPDGLVPPANLEREVPAVPPDLLECVGSDPY